MTSIVDLLIGLDTVVPAGYGEVLATVLIVAAVLGARRLSAWFCARHTDSSAWVRLSVSGAATVLTAVGVVLVIAVWGLLQPLLASFRTLGLATIGTEVVLSGVLIAGAYVLSGLIGQLIRELTRREENISEHQREIVFRLSQVSVYALAGLTIVSLFTNDPSSLLVGAGFLGIVVGMAARQTLGAVLAGFVLMFSRPFEVGDWVEIGDHEGIVTDITVVNTRIQTFDGEYVMLPNDTVSGTPITNRNRKGRLRIEVEVGVDYDDDPRRAAEIAKSAVTDLDEVLRVPTPQVVLKRFGDSSVILGVRVWIDKPSARRLWRARTAVIDAVKDAFVAEGITIPFPQRSVSGRDADGEGPVTLAGGPPEAADDGGPVKSTDGGGSDE